MTPGQCTIPASPPRCRPRPSHPSRRRAQSPRRRASQAEWRRRSAAAIGAPLTNQVSGRAPPSAFRLAACRAPSVRPRSMRAPSGGKAILSAARGGALRRVSVSRRRRRSGGGSSALIATLQNALGRGGWLDRRGRAAQRRRTGSAPPTAARSDPASGRCPAGRPRRRSSSRGRSRSPAHRGSRRTCRS